jgi:hypothetical protein
MQCDDGTRDWFAMIRELGVMLRLRIAGSSARPSQSTLRRVAPSL